MPNKTIYVKAGDEQLWADTEVLAKRTGRSVSDLIAEGLRLVHAKQAPTAPKPRSITPATASAPRPLVPNPFAARD